MPALPSHPIGNRLLIAKQRQTLCLHTAPPLPPTAPICSKQAPRFRSNSETSLAKTYSMFRATTVSSRKCSEDIGLSPSPTKYSQETTHKLTYIGLPPDPSASQAPFLAVPSVRKSTTVSPLIHLSIPPLLSLSSSTRTSPLKRKAKAISDLQYLPIPPSDKPMGKRCKSVLFAGVWSLRRWRRGSWCF